MKLGTKSSIDLSKEIHCVWCWCADATLMFRCVWWKWFITDSIFLKIVANVHFLCWIFSLHISFSNSYVSHWSFSTGWRTWHIAFHHTCLCLWQINLWIQWNFIPFKKLNTDMVHQKCCFDHVMCVCWQNWTGGCSGENHFRINALN